MAMDSKSVFLPLIHKHRMLPWHDVTRKGDCCGRFEAISSGYFCKSCNFFVHNKCCVDDPEFIEHPLHPHCLVLVNIGTSGSNNYCNVCDKRLGDLFYRCYVCDFDIDLFCAEYPPPEVIDISEKHQHKLTLLHERVNEYFDCDQCGKAGYSEFSYKCHECDLAFHVECVWHRSLVNKHPLEVNHSHHSLHPLKRFTGGMLPDYSAMAVKFDGKCRLCRRTTDDRLFYHCYSCNFTLDLRCVLNPPQRFLLNLKAHDHQLTLLPILVSFTCNACGLKGDRSPYICVQCGFMIHHDCLHLPRLIHINRHEHRVSRTSFLGFVTSPCGVCRQNVDWTYGGYSCTRCPGYVVHSKCATKRDVWNGEELERVPEEVEDIAPYKVIDDNTIQHFSHREHYLRLLHVNEKNKRCRACTHSISLQSFYGCSDCDFNLHQKCAEFPTRKWHVLHNERLTLVTIVADMFNCFACSRNSNSFRYQCGNRQFDVLCGSVSEPFVHPSHPDHPLYYIASKNSDFCSGCQKERFYTLNCVENGCEFFLCFRCATLPQEVKHRVDDHPLSLFYGENASGIYWCDICERQMNPHKWFYTCKDHRASLHTKCVLGDSFGLMPGSTITTTIFVNISYEVVLNNSICRPFCWNCKSRCIYPIMLKVVGTSSIYICSLHCKLWCIPSLTSEDL